jgi:hypothetical protein
MVELRSTMTGARRSLWRRRRAMLLLCALVGIMVFLTVIPTAWATPGEAPLNQTVPPTPRPPKPHGNEHGRVPPAPVPYGGYLYYYNYGSGGSPNSYYPGYTTGYNAPCCCPDNSYPGGYYWPNYPSCGGYYGCYPSSTYW